MTQSTSIIPAASQEFADASANSALPDYELLGRQLTEACHDATNAMPKVTRFGAMVFTIEQHLAAVRKESGAGKRGPVKGGALTFEAWLKQYAPTVPRSTAQDMREIFLNSSEEYRKQLPAKVAKSLSFVDLVTKTAEELPEKLRKYQAGYLNFVSGTSKRSFLKRFQATKEKGGARKKKEGEPEPDLNNPEARALDLWKILFTDFYREFDAKTYAFLPQKGEVSIETLRTLRNDLDAAVKEIEAAAAKQAKKSKSTTATN